MGDLNASAVRSMFGAFLDVIYCRHVQMNEVLSALCFHSGSSQTLSPRTATREPAAI